MNQQTYNRGLRLGIESASLFMLKTLLEDVTKQHKSKRREFEKFIAKHKGIN